MHQQVQRTQGQHAEDDLRTLRGRDLWNLGFGRREYHTVEQYIASLPAAPNYVEHRDPRFPHLILVDPRDGIKKACELVGLRCEADERSFSVHLNYWSNRPNNAAYWMYCNDGRERHRDIERVSLCYKRFDQDENPLTLQEGICFYAQQRQIIKRFTLILAATEYSPRQNHAASIDEYKTVCVARESGDDTGFPTRLAPAA